MSKALALPTLTEVESAIDEVVSALVAYRSEPPSDCVRARYGREDMESGGTLQDLLATERAVLQARDVAYAPVEIGLKHSLTLLGQLVYDLAGATGMHEVANRVAEMDPENEAQRMSPIDAAWNGIGTWYS